MSQITRAELRGISIAGLICLHLNRAGDMAIVPAQIKIDSAIRRDDGNVVVVLSPDPVTWWDNGPVTVIIPPVDVNTVYEETVIDYAAIGDLPLAKVLANAALPPPAPTQIIVGEYLMLDPGPELKIKYVLTYTNAFFAGSVTVRIANAPNNLDTLRILNKLFIGE